MGKKRPSIGRYSRRTSVNKNGVKRKVMSPCPKSQCKSPGQSPNLSPARKKARTPTVSLSPEPSDYEDEDNSSLLSESTLSGDDESMENNDILINLVPKVMNALSKHDGIDAHMTKFFVLVSEGKFPLDNIAFLLWIEVVKWFGCSSTTRMRYSTETKLFWKLGWRLFGSRFVHYMGGFKSHSCLVNQDTVKGSFHPSSTDINFAVPDLTVLREFDPYENGGTRNPGIYNDVVSKLSIGLQNKSACLTFDGKKIKQGLSDESGDVDLLSHEKGLSLQERKDELARDKLEIENAKLSLQVLDDINKEEQVTVLRNSLKKISMKVNNVLTLREKKEYCKKKLIERSGEADWRKGRYAFAISAVTAFIYEIDEFVQLCNTVIENICSHISYLHTSKYLKGRHINLALTEKYMSIDEQESDKSTRLLKQRTDEWFALRSQAKVTGSTLYKAIGCDTVAAQKEHFEKVVCGIEERPPSEFTKNAMKHGTDNEVNAVGTLVGKIMPVLEPDLKFCEEGCVVLHNEKHDPFFVVSPDGSLRSTESLTATKVAVEIKCPVLKLHTEFPPRYLLQCLAEIFVLDVPYLIYVSWTEEASTVFKVYRDDDMVKEALNIANTIYDVDNPVKPTKQQKVSKQLKQDIVRKSKEVEFIGRFNSCKVFDSTFAYDTEEKSPSTICEVLDDISKCYEECYELLRQRASEAVVFLVGDLDRSWERGALRCSPVGWFPKGYSLDCDTMRDIAEEVHTACAEGGIHIPCQSFDGQWHPLVVRDGAGRPLTLFQLQKDVWRNNESKSKKELISELNDMNRTTSWSRETTIDVNGNSNSYIKSTNGGVKLPEYRHICVRNKDKKKEDVAEATSDPTTLMDTVPDSVREAADIGKDVMGMTTINDAIELEAFANNANEENWSFEILDGDIATTGEILIEESDTQEKKTEESVATGTKLDINDMECILALFKSTKDCNKKNQWNDVTPANLLGYFNDLETMSKLLDTEVRVCVRYLKKAKGLTGVKESSTKSVKLQGMAQFLGIEVTENSAPKSVKKRTLQTAPSLQNLALKVISKYSKVQLNVILSEYKFEEEYKTWIQPIENITIEGENCDWFYRPEFSVSRKQLELKCIDSTHLLTRARRKSCTGGIEGLTNEPWTRVASEKSTLLTPIMVTDITDPMSVSMAKTHFSEGVESAMRKNGDVTAADLCRDIRNWWESEDKAGISASTRIEMRNPLRKRLLSLVDFSRFPPATQYVGGWPAQLWEALLASIDAKAYLYSLVHNGTYNPRAFSSLIGETFFSELTLNDRRGHGTVSASEFGQYVGHATEQIQIRLDEDRKFSFCTSKKKVYDVVDEPVECGSDHDKAKCMICKGDKDKLPQNICPKDHPFDKPERRRLPGRRNRDHIPTDRNALQRGTLGVRFEKARCNMSKMLPTDRMGIGLNNTG